MELDPLLSIGMLALFLMVWIAIELRQGRKAVKRQNDIMASILELQMGKKQEPIRSEVSDLLTTTLRIGLKAVKRVAKGIEEGL